MQVRTNTLSGSAAAYRDLKDQLRNSVTELNSIISKYRDIDSFGRHISQMYGIRNQIWEEGEHCNQFAAALTSIQGLYEDCEGRIVDECEGVKGISIRADMELENLSKVGTAVSGILGGSGAAEEINNNIDQGILDAADVLKEIKSQLGTVEDITEIYSLFGGESEFMELLKEYSGEVSKNDIFKMTGYLLDSSNLIQTLETGDAEGLEGLLVKYGKKGAGKLLENVTGVKGFIGATYVSLAVNAGENFVEEIREFQNDPSLGSLAGAVWGATGGAFWDAGSEVAKSVLDLAYALGGKEFDEADFDAAMDFVSDGLETMVEYVGDSIQAVGSAAAEAVTGIAEAAWNGVCGIGETVASWFRWF